MGRGGRGKSAQTLDSSLASVYRKNNNDSEVEKFQKVIHEGDNLTLNIEGVIVRDTVLDQNSELAPIYVSESFLNSSELTESIEQLLLTAPEALKRNIHGVYVLNHYAPDSIPKGAACVEENNLFIWRVADNNGNPGIRDDIFLHELAHLSGSDGGPPNAEEWKQAQQEDKENGKEIMEFLGESDSRSITVYGKEFPLASEYVARFHGKGEDFSELNEDWAKSVEFYLTFENLPQKGLVYNGVLLRFDNIWPARAKIINDFLKG